MSNAIVNFEIDGVKHSLYFGMVATQIIAEKSIQSAAVGEVNNIKAFAYIIFGGLCNYADRNDVERPLFNTAYEIAESIAGDDDLTNRIYNTWSDSKPSIELMKRLNGDKKKVEVKSQSKKTGKK